MTHMVIVTGYYGSEQMLIIQVLASLDKVDWYFLPSISTIIDCHWRYHDFGTTEQNGNGMRKNGDFQSSFLGNLAKHYSFKKYFCQ